MGHIFSLMLLGINRSFIKSKHVTLCRWPAKQTIPLSVLVRNQTKGFGIEISPCPEVVTGHEKRVGWTKELRELATGHGQRRSTVDTRAERRGNMT